VTRTKSSRQLIVTADDFGADEAVNEAVERCHVEGILTAASLMVSAAAAADAVARARRLPRLGVGLHLVLVEGHPTLPPEQIPDLVDSEGRFRSDMARAGIDIFFKPWVRRQLAAEIEAQFAGFAATGLALDHVNAHKHFHLHPTIRALVIAIGRSHGMRAMRAPVEPGAVIRAIEPGTPGIAERLAHGYARRMQAKLRQEGIATADQTFGIAWSGSMTSARLSALLARLPAGLSEIYLHPAISDDFANHAPDYRYRDEHCALLDPTVIAATAGIERGAYADFA